jgi:hypothetical protein
VSVIAAEPRASSATTMSATLIRIAVLVFSAMLDVVFVSETPVGASLTSLTEMLKAFSVERPLASVERTRTE